MSDTMQRRRGRDRANEIPFALSIPKSVDARERIYNDERAPHLTTNALIIEALIFYLDAKSARMPTPEELK